MTLLMEQKDTGLHTDGRTAGILVHVREPLAGDEDGLRAMFRRLSGETIYRRFLMPYPRVPEALAVHLARHSHGRSLVAVAGDEIVGHAMYAWESHGGAEVAIVVEDGWQSRGVGKRLLAELARRAAKVGVENFSGVALGENRRVIGLVDAVFAGSRYTVRDGAYEIRMPLKSLRDETRSAA